MSVADLADTKAITSPTCSIFFCIASKGMPKPLMIPNKISEASAIFISSIDANFRIVGNAVKDCSAVKPISTNTFKASDA